MKYFDKNFPGLSLAELMRVRPDPVGKIPHNFNNASRKKKLLAAARTALLLGMMCFMPAGCASLGLPQPFASDPLTGGVDASQTLLLQIPLPAGLQRFPSHSHITGAGRREGVETLRGYVDQAACAANFYSSLKQHGWQLRMQQRLGNRGIYVYQKGNELACIVFQPQGALTIVDIWVGPRLVDNAVLSFARQPDVSGVNPIQPEEYGSVTESQGSPAPVEKWGVEERPI